MNSDKAENKQQLCPVWRSTAKTRANVSGLRLYSTWWCTREYQLHRPTVITSTGQTCNMSTTVVLQELTAECRHQDACSKQNQRVLLTFPITKETPPPSQPFYGPFSGTTCVIGARRNFWTLCMMQGKINRGRHTDHAAGCHSIWTNQCPPPPSPFLQARCSSCHPTNSVKALKANNKKQNKKETLQRNLTCKAD